MQKTILKLLGDKAPHETVALAATTSANTVTEIVVSAFSSYPPELIVSDPLILESYLYSLAHQWGITQLSIGYLKAYEKLLDEQERRYKKQKKGLRLENFFNALGTAGYHFSNAANAFSDQNDPYMRFNNELAIANSEVAIQRNNGLRMLLEEKLDDIALQKVQLEQTKQSLLSYSKLLKSYRNWLLGGLAENQGPIISAEMKRILQTDITWE